MVRDVIRYVCEVCFKEGDRRPEIEKHELIPLSGLNLEIGQMFKNNSWKDEDSFSVIIISFREILEDHSCLYSGDVYAIPLGDIFKPWYDSDFTDLTIYDPVISAGITKKVSEIISELTDEEYKFALEKLPGRDKGFRLKKTDAGLYVIGGGKVSKGAIKYHPTGITRCGD